MSQSNDPMRLMLVEDDPVSRSFLQQALEALPAFVDVAEDIAQANELVRRHPHSLWLVDANLPDGNGSECLRQLRELRDTPALAITAGTQREELDALLEGGFVEVLLKPVSIALLHGTVRRMLGQTLPALREPTGKLPLWDRERALAAIGGNERALRALRKLFLDELPEMRRQLLAARHAGNAAAMRAVLHKLKAGCGFVGAARIGQIVDELNADTGDENALLRFGFAADDILHPQGDQP